MSLRNLGKKYKYIFILKFMENENKLYHVIHAICFWLWVFVYLVSCTSIYVFCKSISFVFIKRICILNLNFCINI